MECSTCVKKNRGGWRVFISALLTAPLLIEMATGHWLPLRVAALLATLVQFGVGWRFYTSRSLNMDLLIALGSSTAYLYSLIVFLWHLPYPTYFEVSAAIITLVLFGQYLQSKSEASASAAIEKLLELQPRTARVERAGKWVELPIVEISPGDRFQVRPGETIPVDGEVVGGASSVNEALVTGESRPVVKQIDSSVFAGTQNGSGILLAKATGVGSETVLAAIIRLVEKAQSSRAPAQEFVDRLSSYFIPAVVGAALLTWLLWWLVGGGFGVGLLHATAVLIVACPCALGLATPIVMVVASGRGSQAGILIRDRTALEAASHLDALLFDKTGTLTEGASAVVEWVGDRSAIDPLYSLEELSNHPIARATTAYLAQRGAQRRPIERFEEVAGRGVVGEFERERYWVGSIGYAEERGLSFDESLLRQWELAGRTVSLIWSERGFLAAFAIADPIRPTSKRAVEELRKLAIRPIMVTGDRRETAEAVAAEVGILEVVAELLPEGKVRAVEELRESGQRVGMVGDGINDAPALAAADVGFAFGAGSGVAIESAGITLMRNDPVSAVDAVRLARLTLRKMKQNLFFALIYNVLGIPLAAVGLLNPIVAAIAMSASSLSVVGNALLLRRWRGSEGG